LPRLRAAAVARQNLLIERFGLVEIVGHEILADAHDEADDAPEVIENRPPCREFVRIRTNGA